MGDLSRQNSDDTGLVSFIYKKKEPEPIYETPVPPPQFSITLPPSRPAPTAPKPKKMLSGDVLEKLNSNIALNSRYLRNLTKDSDYIDEEARDQRSHKTPVEIRVTFIRVIDVDTCKQIYKAEVFLQAKWSEPLLLGKTQREIDQLDLRKLWDPLINISNVTGDLEEDKTWRTAVAEEPGYKYPIMFYRRRMRGTFIEGLELKSFPVDVQQLTLKVVSERASQEIDIFEDSKELSSVYTENFTDEHEWLIYEHVESECGLMTAADEAQITIYGGMDAFTDSCKHPQADFVCHVARRPGYFLWNTILIMFLVVSLTFSAWAVNADLPEMRLIVVLLLLLAAVSFRFVMAKHLPAMSYLTYLDVYVIASLIFLSVQVIAICGISVPAKKEDGDADNIDTYVGFAMAIVWAIFNVVYLAYLFILGFLSRQKMLDKDNEYLLKKDKLSKRRYKKVARPASQIRHAPLPPAPKPKKKSDKIVYIDAHDSDKPLQLPKIGKKKKEKKRKPTPVESVEAEEKVYTIVPLT